MSETFVQYVVKGNSDTTEGRGGMVERDTFVNLEDAINVVRSGKYGVMGCRGDGEVWERKWRIIDNLKWTADDVKIWGWRRDLDGKSGYGFMNLSDSNALSNPEYVEYLRLKDKFEVNK